MTENERNSIGEYSSFLIDSEYFDSNFKDTKKKPTNSLEPLDFDKILREDYKEILKRYNKNCTAIELGPYIVMYLPHFNKNNVHLKPWTDMLYKVALNQKNLKYFLADSYENPSFKNEDSSDIEQYICDTDSPDIYAFDEHQRIFDCPGICTVESLNNFSEKLLNGKLYLSEPLLPTEPTEPLVKIAVANNFEELIMKSNKNVFITFYAKWCSIGMQLLQKMHELAEILEDDDILFVQIEAELNYIPMDFKYFACPHSLYIPKSDKNKHIVYNQGPRTIENLMAFLVECRSVNEEELACSRTSVDTNTDMLSYRV